ncbi:hypothetical protein N7457_007755 [Penicillium paradoxum]|uniref:uncharacterized protein n=1 Tax=Penicillium paradoxum TaxID=176176 RepID=UPI0025490E02|nr:uncharacterized protein N7457_007755 [Penicillium paradoxum]KAJ5772859.1 hypothetical protein N7457_007755 [Penicillium paradoxum]
MPVYQASAFKPANSRFHYKDPHNDQPGWSWVTVYIGENFNLESSAETIMMCVIQSIKDNEAVVTTHAMHGMGARCISLPIKETGQDLAMFMVMAQAVALWWFEMISLERVTLDLHMIFQAQEPPTDSDYDLLDVLPSWNKPEYSCLNLWDEVVQEP